MGAGNETRIHVGEERGKVMIPQDVVKPSLETRLNLLSKQVLLLLGQREAVDLDGLAAELNVPDGFAHLSVGWLVRSRVVELHEDSSGRLQARMRRPFE